MTSNLWLLLGSGIALFLAGVNVAFLAFLGGNLVGWFKFKVFAVGLLLTYIAMSFSYGAPSTSRVVVGWTALVVDLLAVFWMWVNIEYGRKSGRLGLVPLLGEEPDDPDDRVV